MSKTSSHSPLRKRPTRKAKEKASYQIKKYFKPKTLQVVPEDAEVLYTKNPIKDNNNNAGEKTKRNFKQVSQKQSKADEKESIRKKAKPNGSKQLDVPSASSSSRGSSTSSLSVIVLDSPVVSSNLVVLDSSIVSNETEYGFDALQTDDPTDDEDDVEIAETRKPYWSLYKNRIAIVVDQTKVKAKVIDKLFGSGPETVDSLEIFPFHKPTPRRRSTAFWNTPPRYSMLPKY